MHFQLLKSPKMVSGIPQKVDFEIDASQGSLIWQLANVLVQLKVEKRELSLYRFWISSCLEVWLRGSPLIHQIYLASTGLIGHLVDLLVTQEEKKEDLDENVEGMDIDDDHKDEDFRWPSLERMCFMLLGELMKFNFYNFKVFELSLPPTKVFEILFYFHSIYHFKRLKYFIFFYFFIFYF
jgi:hypothetical protein